jgi:hypothetical protein
MKQNFVTEKNVYLESAFDKLLNLLSTLFQMHTYLQAISI